jgi:hypothetical protein
LTFSSRDSAAPDLADPTIQGELQKVLVAALTGKT